MTRVKQDGNYFLQCPACGTTEQPQPVRYYRANFGTRHARVVHGILNEPCRCIIEGDKLIQRHDECSDPHEDRIQVFAVTVDSVGKMGMGLVFRCYHAWGQTKSGKTTYTSFLRSYGYVVRYIASVGKGIDEAYADYIDPGLVAYVKGRK